MRVDKFKLGSSSLIIGRDTGVTDSSSVEGSGGALNLASGNKSKIEGYISLAKGVRIYKLGRDVSFISCIEITTG